MELTNLQRLQRMLEVQLPKGNQEPNELMPRVIEHHAAGKKFVVGSHHALSIGYIMPSRFDNDPRFRVIAPATFEDASVNRPKGDRDGSRPWEFYYFVEICD